MANSRPNSIVRGRKGGDTLHPPNIACRSAASRYQGDALARKILEGLCTLQAAWRAANAEDKGESFEQKKRDALKLIEDLDLSLNAPVRIKDPAVSMQSKETMLHMNEEGSHKLLNEKGQIVYEGSKLPEALSDGRAVYKVEGKGDIVEVIKTSSARPVSTANTALLVADVTNLMIDAYQAGAFNSVDEAMAVAKTVTAATSEYAGEVMDALLKQDMDKLSEVVLDAMNISEPVSKLVQNVGEITGISELEEVAGKLNEVQASINDAIETEVHRENTSLGEQVLNKLPGREVLNIVDGISDLATGQKVSESAPVQVAQAAVRDTVEEYVKPAAEKAVEVAQEAFFNYTPAGKVVSWLTKR